MNRKKMMAIILSLVLVIGVCPQLTIQAVDLPDNIAVDYVPGEVTGNLFSSFYNQYAVSYSNNGTETTITNDGAIGDGVLSGQEPGAYGVGITVADSSFWRGGNTFVFGVNAKNNSGTPKLKLAVMQTGRDTVMPLEYPAYTDGAEVTNSEYQKYGFTMTVPESYTDFGYCRMYLGFPETPAGETEGSRSVTFQNSSVYLGLEYAYDIEVSADRTALTPGAKSINLSGKIINQLGSIGTLSQNITWYATNDKRTVAVDGITIEYGENGNAVAKISDSVPAGKYCLVAVSDTYGELVKGIDIVISDIKTDYVPSEMPVNLYTGSTSGEFYNSRNYNHNNILLEGETEAMMDVVHGIDIDGNLELYSNRILPDPNASYIKDTETGYHTWDGVTKNYIWPLSGIVTDGSKIVYSTDDYSYESGNLVFSFDVYNSSSYTEPVYNAKLNIARQYIYNKGTKEEIEFPIEYSSNKEGFDVTARTNDKRQKFSGTFIDSGKYKLNQYKYILGMPQGTSKGAKITIENIYIGIEQAYDIEVKTVGVSSVAPGLGGKLNLSAQILNQVGQKGGVTQGDFKWYVLDEAGTEYADGFHITAGADGMAVVNIDKNVAVGNYMVVAESKMYEGFVANTIISVGYNDYVLGEMPENLINDEITAADLLSANNNKTIKLSTETSEFADVTVIRKPNRTVSLTAKRDITDPHEVHEDTDGDGYGDTLVAGETNTEWALSGAEVDISKLNLPSQNGALVYSFKVSNNNASQDVKINFGRNNNALYPTEYREKTSGMEILASGGKWQVFCGTIPNDGVSNMNSYSYSIGLPAGTKKGASVIIKADDIYFGIEKPYDIENNIIGSNSVYVGAGGTISLDADILNQVYRKGSLEQGEFSWYVLDENKEKTVPGITVAAGANGTATVNVTSEVPVGTYNIVAASKLYPGFVKTAEIYVVLPEDAEAEGLAQHIALDFEDGWDEHSANLSGCTASHNTSGVGGSAGSLSVNVTENGGMVTFPIRTEAGNKYKVSAWIRADEAIDTQNGYFVFTNKAMDGGDSVINEVPVTHTAQFAQGKWVYVSAEFSADGHGLRNGQKTGALLAGTVGFRFGGDSSVSYSVDEFFVIPEVNNKVNHENAFKLASFDTDECLEYWDVRPNEGHDIPDKWKVTNGYTPDGYKNTPGALELDAIRSFDAIRPVGILDIEYGKKYKISYYARSMDDIAVGQPIWFYLSFADRTGDGYDAVFNKNYHIHDGRNPGLKKEWQYFEITFDYDFVARNLAEAILGLRTSDLQNSFLSAGGRPHYMLDNVELKQVGGVDFVVGASVYGDANSPEGAQIKFNYIESTKGSFLYRIVRETPTGEYCLETGFTESEAIDFSYTEDLGGDTLRLDLVGTDSYGYYSQIFSMPIETAKQNDKVSLKANNFLWNDDIGEVSATLTYENNTELKNLNIYSALYTADGKLISVNDTDFSAPADNCEEITVSVTTKGVPTAAKAKFFVWYEGSNAPAVYADEVLKATGEFIYVDSNSTSAEENGTYDKPFKTLSSAVVQLEDMVTTTEKNDIYVVLKSGDYILSETLDLSTVASISDKNITFTTLGGKKASISGAQLVTGFSEYEKGIYRASVPAGTMSRQLYVNGIKATRARTVEDVPGFVNLDLADLRTFTNEGLSCTDPSYANYKYPTELELVFFENFCQYRIMPDSVTESDGKSYFKFSDDGNASAWERLELNRTLAATTPVYLENALELLDEPGEWYLDTHENYLYYMPRSFEDVNTAEFILPVVEQLLVAEGTADNPVKNIQIKNIDFCYSTWNYPTENRHFSPNQVMYYQNRDLNSWDGGNEIVPGAVQFKNAHNLTIDNCEFAHIGSNALVLIGVVQNCDVLGNEFYEISCNGINLGEVETSSATFDPQDEKYFVTDNIIANNYVHKVGDDYYSAAGIVVGYPKNTVVRNNEITDSPYMGIHVGWGWNSYPSGGTEKLIIENNYIHDMMNWRLHDGAPIYLVGKTSGAGDKMNEVRGNYIADAKNLHAGIYPDNGTSNWTIWGNVIDTTKYPLMHTEKESMIEYADWLNAWSPSIQDLHVRDNYSTTTHGRHEFTGGTFEEVNYSPNADWDETAQSIVDNAGIERQYLDRFDFDIQMLTLPNMLTLSSGTTQRLYYDARTSKDELCDLSGCEIAVKSSNENIVTATKDSVTAVGAGKAFLTYAVCRKDASGKVIYYDEHRFIVDVK